MRPRKYSFTPKEVSQLLIDKLIADGELKAGESYFVKYGATKLVDEDMVTWIEVSDPSQAQPTPSKQEKM